MESAKWVRLHDNQQFYSGGADCNTATACQIVAREVSSGDDQKALGQRNASVLHCCF